MIRRYTELSVQVAADGMPVEINHVYVLPADAILGIEHRRLSIRKPTGSRGGRKPIDIFFGALAADLGDLAAGVVLSGGDSDGTIGIKAIKEHGGLTMAQVGDGHGPRHPDMPKSAISTGLVDFAIPAHEMGPKLVEFARSLNLIDGIALPAHSSDQIEAFADVRREIYAILRNQIGHDFGGYKQKTFLRRVQRRMQVRQLSTIEAYVELLRQEPQEVGALFRDLLINVTNFFRDSDAFDALSELVIPHLFEARGADDTVRIWVPGCSTGEEVFSIGILLREYMGTLPAAPRVQIFATDIDERALAVARSARYPEALLDSVSPERRTRFFIPDSGSYVISKEVRDLCIFSRHSVIRDPPFSRIDLVSCRNLLIYFGLDVQAQVIPIFHYALRQSGYLFLGTSENIGQFNDLFSSVDKKHRIFRKRSDGAPPIRLPLMLSELRAGQATEAHLRGTPLGGIALRQSVENQVLEQFAPPYVVVNRDGDVVFYSARTGKYLEAAAGAPTRQILAIARKGLRMDLRTVLREVVETGEARTRENIAIESDDGRVQTITLTIEPAMQRDDGSEPLYLVLFSDQGALLSREEARGRAFLAQDGTATHLDHELRETRERLQSLIEEYETALEELKSSNEELVSTNEELQSSNEELEASKEELQSVNEELHTVNTDLSLKIEALDRANSDLKNLFDSTHIATIFLDQNLVIRSFTPAVAEIFNVLPSDCGRPITDITSRFKLSNFAEDIAAVAAGHGPIERRTEYEKKRAHYLVRVAAYRDGGQKNEGVVVTFINVTNLTIAEAQQRLLIAELQHRTRNLLAVVQSIARRTLARGDTLDSFSNRLGALGRVQGLIAHSASEQVDLRDIIRLELQAHGFEVGDKITVSGPPTALSPETVQTLSLVLHELATNAVKHGALKMKQGTVDITWSLTEADHSPPVLTLDWHEHGVRMPQEVPKRGYGRELIEKALTFTLNATTDLGFGGDGISCCIRIPLASHETNTQDERDVPEEDNHG